MKHLNHIIRTALLAFVLASLTLLNAHGATFVVTTTADSGPGSLRQAIVDANADSSPGSVDIEFNIPGAGVQTITPLSPLPIITRSVTMDGYTQPGTSPNTLANADNAVLRIELNGANLSGPFASGLMIAANDCTVRGMVFNRFAEVAGIFLFQIDHTVIAGNFLGTDATGTLALGNFEGLLVYGASGTQVGGLTPASRNLFGGNAYGLDIFVGSVSNQVRGNFIGVGPDGATPVPNGYGILMHNSAPTQIGGNTSAARNVISGNGNGIWVNNFGSNVFQGNFIGTDASGTLARGNLSGLVLNESPNNLIGGTGAGEGNLISGNLSVGIAFDGLYSVSNIVAGNLIGPDVSGANPLGNGYYGVLFQGGTGTLIGGLDPASGNVISSSQIGVAAFGIPATNISILGNSIFDNVQQGIELGSISPAVIGPTPNDATDADDGANHYQNFPEIIATAIGSGSMSVDYLVDSTTANSAYPLTVEFFIADAAGQGRTFLHRATYSTPQATEHITFVPAVMPVEGDKIVATATDASGNTSEFPIEPVVVVEDTTPPTVGCPANVTVDCSGELLAAVTYPAPTAADNLDPSPTVTCTPASGSAGFAVGINTVVCTAVDSLGHSATCSFTVSRAALGFTGFLAPIGGEVLAGTGGSSTDPLRAFKYGSIIPVKFHANCGGSAVVGGVHTLQATKYSSVVDSDPAIDATPRDAATTGNQFRLTGGETSGEWHFNLNTKQLTVGTWKLTATLSDGSLHEVWVTIKK